ncbi:DUF59 domain-containing protein [uncultured Gammaproteobacteria bacterium]
MPDDTLHANLETTTTGSSLPPLVTTQAGISEAEQALLAAVIEALHTVYDPEIPVDIWELGLIYRVKVEASGDAEVDMTLTAPNCPVAGDMPEMVRGAVMATEGITECRVELVWEPPWTPERMSEVARLQLDMF